MPTIGDHDINKLQPSSVIYNTRLQWWTWPGATNHDRPSVYHTQRPALCAMR